MKVLIFSRILKKSDIPYLEELLGHLKTYDIDTFFYQPYWEQIEKNNILKASYPTLKDADELDRERIDYLITLGGDGTILGALNLVRDTQVPVVGINLGRMGFLADIEKMRIEEAVSAIKNGRHLIEERTLIQLDANVPLFGDLPYALNDFTLLKRDTSSMVTVHAYVNGDYLNTYWSDGIILATPTGSTGYSLSCGGPIVFPNSDNFVITPVAPHNLNVRPIVIPDDAVVSFEIEGRAENFLCTLDSRFETINAGVKLAVRKAQFKLALVQLEEGAFLHTIRHKLTWGMDMRNKR